MMQRNNWSGVAIILFICFLVFPCAVQAQTFAYTGNLNTPVLGLQQRFWTMVWYWSRVVRTHSLISSPRLNPFGMPISALPSSPARAIIL